MSVPPNTPFKITDIPGKGKGVIATRAISRGEVVISERPLFIQSYTCTVPSIASALSAISKEEQVQFLSLKNCHAGDKSTHPLIGTFSTNCFPLGDHSSFEGTNASSSGIFLTCSRFNSSCRPNISNKWDENGGVLRMYALRDIPSDEELCICYAELLDTRKNRMDTLRSKFRFDCSCEVCSLRGEKLKQSDARRTELNKLYKLIGTMYGGPRESLRMVRRAINLIDTEGLAIHKSSLYYDGYQCCISVSDVKHAKEFLQKAYEYRKGIYGAAVASWYLEYIEHPTRHRLFGVFPKATLTGPD